MNLGYPVAPLILLLHLFLDCASFWDRPKLSTSFLTQSHQVFFRRPLCLIPSTSHVIQRLTQSLSSFRSTCPNHLNLLFLIIKLTGSNPKIGTSPIQSSLPSHITGEFNRPANGGMRNAKNTFFFKLFHNFQFQRYRRTNLLLALFIIIQYCKIQHVQHIEYRKSQAREFNQPLMVNC